MIGSLNRGINFSGATQFLFILKSFPKQVIVNFITSKIYSHYRLRIAVVIGY